MATRVSSPDQKGFGNIQSTETDTNGEYRFDIANYIREIMNEDIQNKGLYLFPVTGSENFNRSVITSGRNSNRMKLIITYTKL